jgi:hypothetical protein
MHLRTLVLERDDPAEPGLLTRRYARVLVCWEMSIGGWGWALLNAAGELVGAMQGPFAGAELAWEEAQRAIGGAWEEPERI